MKIYQAESDWWRDTAFNNSSRAYLLHRRDGTSSIPGDLDGGEDKSHSLQVMGTYFKEPKVSRGEMLLYVS